MKRYAHNLSHTRTFTGNMGLCYPADVFEVYPGDSFRIKSAILARFLPQVAPTMHDVFFGVDTYQVPWRQLFDKLGISWDDFLTGGEDGLSNPLMPKIVVPVTGWEPGSLADFLGYPTNYNNPDLPATDPNYHVIVAAGQTLNALPIVCYMHIINENYRDQNFVKKLDLTQYEAFINGTYVFEDASGNPLTYPLLFNGVFPKAWSRDYFGRALPNTQRGPQAQLPLTGTVGITPAVAPVSSQTVYSAGSNAHLDLSAPQFGLSGNQALTFNYTLFGVSGTVVSSTQMGLGFMSIPVPQNFSVPIGSSVSLGTVQYNQSVWDVRVNAASISSGAVLGYLHLVRLSGTDGVADYASPANTGLFDGFAQVTNSFADLSQISGINQGAASIIAFRLAARMQAFGEILQKAGARAVEFTLAMFGVRIPDERIQRPIFHGSFRLPVIFSEVLQTSSTDATSPQGNLAGHGITGGTNQPIHIKVIEHGYVMSIIHVMPRSQFQNIIPNYLDRFSRFDIPNPTFMHVGEQILKRKYIYPNSANPEEAFGFVPRYSELTNIPSTLHGHMKDVFLHWTMARLYNQGEPVLSAAWRYEHPSNRSFAVLNEDQMQIQVGYQINARRVFAPNPRAGIHIV